MAKKGSTYKNVRKRYFQAKKIQVKFFDQKNFDKTNYRQKKFDQQIFQPKIVWTENSFLPKNFRTISFRPKKFDIKVFLSSKFFNQINILSTKKFQPEDYSPKKISTEKIIELNNLSNKFFFPPIFIIPPEKIFSTKIFHP